MPGWGGQSQLLVQGRGGAANRGFCCFKSSASVWLNQGASACLWEGCSGTTALQLAPPSPPPPWPPLKWPPYSSTLLSLFL